MTTFRNILWYSPVVEHSSLIHSLNRHFKSMVSQIWSELVNPRIRMPHSNPRASQFMCVIWLSNTSFPTYLCLNFQPLPFPDGAGPPQEVVRRWLEIVRDAHGAIAIHCVAGLGR
eukprot:c15273_g1_i1.p1 GENE.c15273_g1_i1~~c15273_g1_i1.p1  ORF type:complete len:115 (+),score=4.17 c15273_g1_i1:176-520(+)